MVHLVGATPNGAQCDNLGTFTRRSGSPQLAARAAPRSCRGGHLQLLYLPAASVCDILGEMAGGIRAAMGVCT